MIDSRIPLLVNQPQIQSPGEVAQSIMPLKALMDQEALRKAFVFTPEGQLDPEATFQNTARVNPLYALQLRRELNVEDFRGERTKLRQQALDQQKAKMLVDAMKKPWASAASAFLFNGDIGAAQGQFKKQMFQTMQQMGMDPNTTPTADWSPELSDQVLSGQYDQKMLQSVAQHVNSGAQISPALMTDSGEPMTQDQANTFAAGGGAPGGATDREGNIIPVGSHFLQEEPGKWWTHSPTTAEEGQKWGKLMSILSTQKGFKMNQPYITLPVEAGGGVVKNPYYWRAKEDEYSLKQKYGQGGTNLTINNQQEQPLSKAEQTKVQDHLVGTEMAQARLQNVAESFDPTFLQLPTQWAMKGLSALDKAGIPLSKDNRDKLEAYSTFQDDAFDNMNRYIKEITGQQMSELEANRLRKAMPDPERDSPVQFKAKLDRSTVILQRAGDIYKDMLRKGISVERAQRAAADSVLDGMAPRKVLPKAGAAPATPGAAAPPAKAGPPGPDPLGIR